MENDRHLFPGGNTPLGFWSYYPYILPQEKASHIFCIKGGPGVGKSTFMKLIGRAMGERGLAVETMHCSSDPGSLDGVVIPELATALIDGTAPHVVDPKHPGAVDEIVNLGDYWDLQGIKEHRGDILETNAGVGRLFARVYRLLAAARRMQEDEEAACAHHANMAGVDLEFERFLPAFSEYPAGKRRGCVRKLFASAITPEGLINYLPGLAPKEWETVVLRGPGRLPSAFLARVLEEAVRRGLDTEAFYCPMDPAGDPEHLLIPALGLAFVTGNRYHAAPEGAAAAIDFSQYADLPSSGAGAQMLVKDGEMADELLAEAVATLRQAKALHDHMETFYVPNMDFDAISRLRGKIAERILAGGG